MERWLAISLSILIFIVMAFFIFFNVSSGELTPLNIYFTIVISLMLLALIAVLFSLVGKEYSWKKSNIPLRNIPEEFEKVYSELCNNNIVNELERKRRKGVYSIIPAIALFIIGFLMTEKRDDEIISQGLSQNDLISIIVGIGLIAISIFIGGLAFKNIQEYKHSYKKEIIANFIKLINEKLKYRTHCSEQSLIEEEYKKADFDDEKFNTFLCSDYLEGNLSNNIFIKAVSINIGFYGGAMSDSAMDVFKGMFVITNCNNIEKHVKISLKSIIGKSNRIRIANKEFEKHFNVYSEDETLVTKLLTPDIINLIINYYNKYKLGFEIVLKNNHIYLRFFTGPIFEPKLLGSSVDKKTLFTYYSVLKFVLEITEKINSEWKEIDI